MARPTVDQLLAAARDRLERLTPAQAAEAVRTRGAILVDIRSDHQRVHDGVIPGARYHPRNVLEWRVDPTSGRPDPELTDPDAEIVLFCDAGYASSLAAVSLQDMGCRRATDLDGGFQAWRAAGLPVAPAPPEAAGPNPA